MRWDWDVTLLNDYDLSVGMLDYRIARLEMGLIVV